MLIAKETIREVFENLKFRPQEQRLVSCGTTYARGCGGGWTGDAFDYMMREGLDLIQNLPYTSGNNGYVPICPANTNPMHKSIQSYQERYTINHGSSYGAKQQSGNCNRLKQLLTAGAVATHMYVSANFHYYRGGIFTDNLCPTNGDTNHAVVVSGFIRNYQNTGRDVFVIKNSWDTWWGANGYMYIDANYSTNPCGLCSWLFYY